MADWLYIITEAVKDIPDGELFRSAVYHGERALEISEQQRDDYWLSTQLSRLGALHFLPYARKLRDGGDTGELRWWSQRARDSQPGEGVEMPEPLDALQRACGYFRRMVAVPGDEQQGFGYKCLAQALESRRILGDKDVDRTEIVVLARKALHLLPNEPDWRLELSALLRSVDEPIDLIAEIARAERKSADQIFGGTIEDQLAALRISCNVNPSDAVALAERLWEAAAISEDRRIEIANLYGQALACLTDRLKLFPSKIAAKFMSRTRPFERAVSRLTERLQREKSSDTDRFRAMLGLAAASALYDAEAQGLELAFQALDLRAQIPPAAVQMGTVLAALVAVGAGVNEWSSRHFTRAATAYIRAAKLCLDAKLTERSRDIMLRGVEALERAQFPPEFETVVMLAGIAPTIEAADSAGNVTRHLSALWNGYLELALQRSDAPTFIFVLLQAAKATQFSASLDERRRWSVETDATAARLLEDRAQLQPEAEPRSSNAASGAEFFMVGVDSPPQQEGATAAERLGNIEREFDALVQRRTTKTITASVDYLIGLEEAFNLLDDRTALLVLHSGRTVSDQIVERMFLATKRRRIVFGQNLLGQALTPPYGISIHDTAVDDLGPLVASARTAIQEGDLADGNCETEGANLLRDLRRALLGGLEPTLKEMRATGIDHLAICAHGSTHFLPWHLLLDGDQPLADRFIVTHLPSLALLRPRPDPDSRARSPMAAFGLRFADDRLFGLPQLDGVEAELDGIARASGVDPKLDGDATEAALIEAFATFRRVHVATHGEQCATAPAFHRLYLSPGTDGDGILHAYEIISHDLRGLDLITLSACETALGRIDRSDNLRGLPAALFQAGAATIIGTLWEVSDDAAALFFAVLYERLAHGDDKLASFAEAQRETRRAFPQFRDWGAFQYSGQW